MLLELHVLLIDGGKGWKEEKGLAGIENLETLEALALAATVRILHCAPGQRKVYANHVEALNRASYCTHGSLKQVGIY